LANRSRDNVRLGLIAKKYLEQYFYLLEQEQKSLGLSEAELNLVRDSCKEITISPDNVRFLWAHVDEAIRLSNLDERWNVDGGKLIKKLRFYSLAQCFALADKVDLYLSRTEDDSV
jgi:hypothetical protein